MASNSVIKACDNVSFRVLASAEREEKWVRMQ